MEDKKRQLNSDSAQPIQQDHPEEEPRSDDRKAFVAPKLVRHEKLPEVTGFTFPADA